MGGLVSMLGVGLWMGLLILAGVVANILNAPKNRLKAVKQDIPRRIK